MNLFGILVVWLGVLVSIPYAAFLVDCDDPNLQAADVALNLLLLHGLTKILNVFIPSYISAVLEAALMGAIYYNSPRSGENDADADAGPYSTGERRLSGLYSAGTLESFEGVALFFVWPFFLFETWQVAKIVWNIPSVLKRIYEYSSSENSDNSVGYRSGYWCDQMVSMDQPSSWWYTLFELLVMALCLGLCILSAWLHFLVYGSGASSITKVAGYAIAAADTAAVVLAFKAGNGMFVGAICNVSFVSFNMYRGYLNYSLTRKSWKLFFADTLSEIKSFILLRRDAPAPAGGPAMSVAHPVALAASVVLAALVVFLFVAGFMADEDSLAEEEKASNEVEEEMAKLEGTYAGYLVRSKVKELGIALVQYLIEGALMVSYAGAVLALSKNVGPGYYARLLQSVALLGLFMVRICAMLNAQHEKMD